MPISTTPGSLLARLHPARRDVPVYHHQAIDTLGDGLIGSAWGDNDVIEAVEDPALTFCVGVQWHPERDPGASGLYEALADAARAFHAQRLSAPRRIQS